MYLISGITALVIPAIVYVLFDVIDLFENSATLFVMRYGAENLFVFLMVYFHWPFERLMDRRSDVQSGIIQPDTLIIDVPPIESVDED